MPTTCPQSEDPDSCSHPEALSKLFLMSKCNVTEASGQEEGKVQQGLAKPKMMKKPGVRNCKLRASGCVLLF